MFASLFIVYLSHLLHPHGTETSWKILVADSDIASTCINLLWEAPQYSNRSRGLSTAASRRSGFIELAPLTPAMGRAISQTVA